MSSSCPYCSGPWPCWDERCIEAEPCPDCGHPTRIEPLPWGEAIVYCNHCGLERRWPPPLAIVLLSDQPETDEEVLPF
jgi:hypothetical protein